MSIFNIILLTHTRPLFKITNFSWPYHSAKTAGETETATHQTARAYRGKHATWHKLNWGQKEKNVSHQCSEESILILTSIMWIKGSSVVVVVTECCIKTCFRCVQINCAEPKSFPCDWAGNTGRKLLRWQTSVTHLGRKFLKMVSQWCKWWCNFREKKLLHTSSYNRVLSDAITGSVAFPWKKKGNLVLSLSWSRRSLMLAEHPHTEWQGFIFNIRGGSCKDTSGDCVPVELNGLDIRGMVFFVKVTRSTCDRVNVHTCIFEFQRLRKCIIHC